MLNLSSFYSTFVSLCNSTGKSPSRVVLDVGLQKSSITRWKGGGLPTDATVKKIADYFGVPVEELTEKQKEPPQPKAETVGPNKQALLDVIDKMSEAEMILLLERAKRIIESRG